MPSATPLFPGTVVTGELLEFLAHATDLGPCELVEGQIIPVSPTTEEHGYVERQIAAWLLATFDRAVYRISTGEVGVYTKRNPDSVRGADIVVTTRDRAAKGFIAVPPVLIVDVMSPEQARELRDKTAEYLNAGVDAVWTVDLEAQQIERHTTGGAIAFRVGDTIPFPDGTAQPVPNLFV